MLTFTEQIDNILNQATTSYDQNYGNDHNIVTSPWDVESLYEFQYFNCPTCPYKHKSAQDFVDHAFNTHQESKNHFMNISNHDSFSDIWPIFVFDPILTKLCEIVALMGTTISQSFIKIGSKTKNFYY